MYKFQNVSPPRILKAPEFYLCGLSFLLNFMWELGQMPFFSFKGDDHASTVLYCAFHCTSGDVLITLGAFEMVSLVNKNRLWFLEWKRRDVSLYMAFGILYTVICEIISVYYLDRWNYEVHMPLVPLLGVGLIPLAAWFWIPLLSLYIIKVRRINNS